MEKNVSSFRVAIGKGYEPRLYSYDPGKIPLGAFDAMLDFKTWSKRIFAINCYFTKAGTGEKFVVTVYCSYKTGRFEVPGSAVDFAHCAAGVIYGIVVEKNAKEKVILAGAKPAVLS